MWREALGTRRQVSDLRGSLLQMNEKTPERMFDID